MMLTNHPFGNGEIDAIDRIDAATVGRREGMRNLAKFDPGRRLNRLGAHDLRHIFHRLTGAAVRSGKSRERKSLRLFKTLAQGFDLR
jgi:hypothetical protein